MPRGYLHALESCPDTSLSIRLSDSDPSPDLVVRRLVHSDPNTLGPGILSEELTWEVKQAAPVREEAVPAGSCAVVSDCFVGDEGTFTLAAWIYPTYLREAAVLASWVTEHGPALLEADGRGLRLELAGETLVSSPHELHERQWHFVAVGVDADDASVQLSWGQHGRTAGPFELARPVSLLPLPRPRSPLVMGGMLEPDGTVAGAFDGKLHRPCLLRNRPDPIALMDLMNWGVDRVVDAKDLLALWEFGGDTSLWDVVDRSPNGRNGSLRQAPSLGVSGPATVGRPTPEPAAGKRRYETVHLHRDDLDDCAWLETHHVKVPPTAQSGFYSVHVTSLTGEADLPFVVLPTSPPPVLLLAPTYTWQAYANLGRDPDRYPGLSHYALHRDGSPVYVTTRLKPMPTIAPGARIEVDSPDAFTGAEADDSAVGAHLLMADLYANYWLEQTGTDFGVITDGHLHAAGDGALEGCRTLVLSAHPEYWTRSMLDTLERFVDGGGSLMYLGGNGLYWVTSVDPDRPHLMEVRRKDGSQTWQSEAGEDLHVFELQQGGTWAARGRPPNSLVSIGFAGFGWDDGVAYRRTEASYRPEFAWVFEGVSSEAIGGSGLNMGGAVAFEFDSYDPELAPPSCTVLATAVPEGGGFFRSFEHGRGQAPDPETRCDLTIRTTAAGGTVLSLGSVTATGCLPVDGGRNDLARLLTNVLLHTLAES